MPGTHFRNICTEENCGTVNGVDCNLSADLNIESITCNGFQNGSAEVVFSGGTDPVVIAWSTGESTPLIDGLSPGGYSVTVSDAQNCETVLLFDLAQPDVLNISFNTTNPSSDGANDGSVTATPSGGTPGYEFAWNNGMNGQTISNLIAGIYVVTVTDINGCVQVNEVELSDPSVDCSSFEGQLFLTDQSCGVDGATGEAQVFGGMEPYEYLWSNAGEVSAIVFGLQTGVYTVTVTDADDCQIILEGDVFVPDPMSVILDGTSPSVPGGSDGLISATPFGGVPSYTYLWNTVPVQTTQTITLMPAGTYSVTVTDNTGCTAENVITINDPDVDCGSFDGQLVTTNMTCSTQGAIESIVDGGAMPYEYLWSNDEITANIDGLAAGIYTVTIIDANDCEMVMTSEITTPTMMNIVESVTNPSSPGGNDGTATATASGGLPPYNYQWDNGGMTAEIIELSAGTYTVIVTDANDCSETVSVTLIDPSVDCADFIVDIPSIVEITCNGFQNGALVAMAANGELPYSYAWSNGIMTAVNGGLGAGIYSVTATDLNGCTAEVAYELVEPSALNLTVSSVPVSSAGAMDGSATANPTGGTPDYTYEWDNSEITQTINNLAEGIYSVTVTDANGCLTVETVIIGIDGVDCSDFSIVDFEVVNVNCFGGFDGSATAISVGGAEPILYEWSNAASGQTINGLQSGIYVVTATDANDCQTVNEVEISQPAAGLNVDFSTTPESSPGASDGAIDATVTGGTPTYGYEWSNGAMTEDLNNIEAGTYELVVTDANGCIHSISIIVPGNGIDCSTFILDTQMENVSCNGAQDGLIVTTASGGIQPITYNWESGEMTQSLFNLSGGIYVVTIVDGNGCEIIEEFEITEAPPIILTPFSSDETAVGANDGTAAVAAAGGIPTYTYNWSNGAVTASILNLEPGPYSVSVTDAAGCTSVENFEIVAFTDLCVGFDASVESTPVDCSGNNNGTATALPTGGLAPYSYDWSNGSNSANNNNISGGSYSVTVTDANQCAVILSVDVEEPNDLVVNVEGFGGTCGSGGTAVSTVTGGTQSYTYQWSNGGTGNSISNLADGVYTVTITDANGCSTDGETVIENTIGGVDIESEVEGISCFGDSDGEVDITVVEGTAPFTFEWSNGATTEDIDDLEGGAYNVLITDAEGCSFVTTFVVPSPAELLASVNVMPSGGNNMGTATANAFGGTTPYNYSWSNGAGGFFVDNLSNGSYTLTVTDANGCTTETDFIISTTAINELPGLEEMNVSPNPSNGQFVLNATFNSFKQGSIEVYNVIGQRVYEQSFSAQDLTLDIGLMNQAAGSYILVIRTEEGRAIEKLIITK